MNLWQSAVPGPMQLFGLRVNVFFVFQKGLSFLIGSSSQSWANLSKDVVGLFDESSWQRLYGRSRGVAHPTSLAVTSLQPIFHSYLSPST